MRLSGSYAIKRILQGKLGFGECRVVAFLSRLPSRRRWERRSLLVQMWRPISLMIFLTADAPLSGTSKNILVLYFYHYLTSVCILGTASG